MAASIPAVQADDTICAIATGAGGALGIIRVSGSDALQITDKIFKPKGRPTLAERPASSIVYGTVLDENGDMVDEVLVSVFRAPHSYTGEDSTEISCHNSPYVLQKTMQLLLKHGCRLAAPGEYTQRAFLNGKMDLSQAESVADLIAATSAGAHRMAVNQLKGSFSKELQQLRDKLLHISSLMELELDFSDHEELEFADRGDLAALVTEIENKIQRLAHSFRMGNAIKNGVPVAIVGLTNVGKSTLLNALLGEDKAIVSDMNGTTRDTIEDTLIIDGITFRFIDTAGIRSTDDEVERLGIQKTIQTIQKAAIVIWLLDASRREGEGDIKSEIEEHHHDAKVIAVVNKMDLLPAQALSKIKEEYKSFPYPTLFISAKQGDHLSELRQELLSMVDVPKNLSETVIVSNLRHYEALCQALESIQRIHQGLEASIPTDLLTQDLKECINSLNEIMGEITSADVLHNIFKHFCIGK